MSTIDILTIMYNTFLNITFCFKNIILEIVSSKYFTSKLSNKTTLNVHAQCIMNFHVSRDFAVDRHVKYSP